MIKRTKLEINSLENSKSSPFDFDRPSNQIDAPTIAIIVAVLWNEKALASSSIIIELNSFPDL